MAEISSLDIVRWHNEILSPNANDSKGYSLTYLRTVNNQLTAILSHAARFYGLSPNSTVRTMKIWSMSTKEMSFWTKDEYLTPM